MNLMDVWARPEGDFNCKDGKFPSKGQPLTEHLQNVEEHISKNCSSCILAKNLGYLHDIAKASQKFQNKLKRCKHNKFRHPIAALPIADFVFMRLEPDLEDKERLMKLMVIYYHHSQISANMIMDDLLLLNSSSEKSNVLVDESDLPIIREVLKSIMNFDFSEGEFREYLHTKENNSFSEAYANALKNILKDIYKLGDSGEFNKKRFSIAYSCLVEADWKDSGHADERIVNWGQLETEFDRAFNKRIQNKFNGKSDPIKAEITERLSQYINKKHVLLEAPTGAGKSEASLKWALKSAQNIKGVRKIIYVLPFKALIKDLHQRFISYIGNENVDKWDSDYKSDLLVELSNKKVIFSSYSDFNFYKIEKSYFMKKPLVITTADQILMTFLNVERYPIRRGLFSDAIFVFDEVQAYGEKFRALIYHFIDKVEPKATLIMTATPPKETSKTLGSIEILSDDRWIKELHEKYNASVGIIKFKEKSKSKLIADVLNNISSNDKRIAIIVNTVQEAIDLYEAMKYNKKEFKQLNTVLGNKKIILLHSNMMFEDRESRLNEALNLDEVLLISTQVLEAGVDITFDLMMRELAPLASVVQSMGRVNRGGENPNAKFILLVPEESLNRKNSLPYSQEDLEETLSLVNSIFEGDKTLSTKSEFEKIAREISGRVSEKRFFEEKTFIDYVVHLLDRNIWSTYSVSDVLGEDLRNNIFTKSYFVIDSENKGSISEKIKETYKRLQKEFAMDLLEQYLKLLSDYSNRILNISKWKVKKWNEDPDSDFISINTYKKHLLGEDDEN